VDTDFVYLFTKTTKALKIVKASLLQEHGVYVGQDFVLRALWDAEGLTPKELAAKLGIAVPTVAKMAQRMEHAGLVSRRRDERDGRLVRVFLTDRAGVCRRTSPASWPSSRSRPLPAVAVRS